MCVPLLTADRQIVFCCVVVVDQRTNISHSDGGGFIGDCNGEKPLLSTLLVTDVEGHKALSALLGRSGININSPTMKNRLVLGRMNTSKVQVEQVQQCQRYNVANNKLFLKFLNKN